MAEVRCRRECSHTSAILAMLVNVNRDSKRPALDLDHFDPYARRAKKKVPLEKVKLSVLKDVFVKQRPRSAR